MSSSDDVAAGPRPRAGARRLVTVAAVLVIAIVAAIVIYQWTSDGPTRPSPRAAPSPSPSASKLPTTAEIFDAVAPSVVSIVAVAPGKSGREDSGTGIVVNADGTILTALHVVKGAGTIHVTFADGTNATAKVTATEPTSDIAMLGPDSLPSIV